MILHLIQIRNKFGQKAQHVLLLLFLHPYGMQHTDSGQWTPFRSHRYLYLDGLENVPLCNRIKSTSEEPQGVQNRIEKDKG